MLNQVELVKTTYEGVDIVQAFIEAWYSEYHEIPSEGIVGVLYAQNSLETGYSKSMWNNNIGNIKAIDKSVGTINYVVLPGTWEILSGKKVVLSPDNPGSRFLAFDSLQEGVLHHLRFLKGKRFAKAWNTVLTGDPAKFSHELKMQMYYTADEATYTRNVVWIFDKYKKDKLYSKALEKVKIKINPLPIPLNFDTPEEKESDLSSNFNWWQNIVQFFIKLFSR